MVITETEATMEIMAETSTAKGVVADEDEGEGTANIAKKRMKRKAEETREMIVQMSFPASLFL